MKENHETVTPEEMMKMPRMSLGPSHEHIVYLNKSTLIWYNMNYDIGYHRYNGSEYPDSNGVDAICICCKEDQHELLLQNGYELVHEVKHYYGISRRYCKKVRNIKQIKIQFCVFSNYNSWLMNITIQFYSDLQLCQEAATGWYGVSYVKIDEVSSKLFKILLTDAQIEAINNCIDEFNILCGTINLEHNYPSSTTIIFNKEVDLRGDINVKRYNL